jgi:hypothetical protein
MYFLAHKRFAKSAHHVYRHQYILSCIFGLTSFSVLLSFWDVGAATGREGSPPEFGICNIIEELLELLSFIHVVES